MKIKTRDMILVALFAALTAIGAFIKIPLPHVPLTLQFFFVAFSGILLGSKLGALSQILYVGIGLAGVPWFTKGGGIGYVFQTSFGYLIGFIFAAYIIGKIVETAQKLTFTRALVAILVGLAVVYLIGVPYLYFIFKLYLGTPKSVAWAVKVGFLMSITGDLIKTFLIAIISCKVVPILRKAGLIQYSR